MIVEFVQPCDIRNGPHFNPGERASLDDALAQDLIHRGIAKPYEEVMPIPAASDKSLTEPPAHRAILAPKGKKGSR